VTLALRDRDSRRALVYRVLGLAVQHPWAVLALLLPVFVLASAGVTQLRFSDDIRVFFHKDNPQLLAYESLENTYSKNNSVLIVIAPQDGDVFTRKTLASIEKLTEMAWKTPHSRRVDSITNFQHTYAQEDDLVVDDLVRDAPSLSDEGLARIRQVALSEPLLVNRLVSPRGDVAGVNVPIILPGVNKRKEQPEVVAYLRNLAAQLEVENPNLKIYLTGKIMLNNALAEAGRQDMRTLIPAMLLVVLVILGLLLRNVSGVIATLAVILLSIGTGLGLAGWLGIVLSPPVLSAANIIMTLAVAHTVHILVTFLHGMHEGQSRAEAMTESLRRNVQPVFITSFTTALGFLSMNFSESPPFRDLGNIVSMGMVAAWCLSMFLLPALIMIMPLRVREQRTRGFDLMDRLAEFVISRRRMLLLGMGGFTLVAVAFIPRNELNDEFIKYFDENTAFRIATDYTIENLTGIDLIEYSLESAQAGDIHEPEYMRAVDAFAEWYRDQPEVRHVAAITDILKRLNMNMHGDDPAWHILPGDRELAAQYLLLYELSLPFGLDMNDQINIDKSATLFRATLNAISTNGILDLERRAADWLENNAPAEMRNDGSGQSVMFAHIGYRNVRGLLGGTTIVLVLISLMLIFALRSLKYGLMSLIPNLAPAAIAFGLWGMMVGQVGLALSVVVGMTLGIVVDDTVHFMSKYLHALRDRGESPEAATRYAFHNVGMAMVVTSLVLVAGFAVLAFSNFELNAGMGLLSALTIAVALAADLLLLPPLLLMLYRRA
jgi:hypothetical protein